MQNVSRTILSVLAVIGLNVSTTHAASPSPYVGQEQRDIKALSPDDIENYLQGSGMGLAKAAELNRYPGPRHVLDLADELKLTKVQREKTGALHTAMQKAARALGKKIIVEEQELDTLFRSARIDAEGLRTSLARIAQLQAELRFVHLNAHLDQRTILNPEQLAAYDRLRGYDRADAGKSHGHGHHGH